MIRVESLVKKFRHRDQKNHIVWKTAVDGLSLDIARGEVFQLVRKYGFPSSFGATESDSLRIHK